MEMEHSEKMLFSFPLQFSFSGIIELFDFSEILPTFHYICILLQIYLYLAFFFGQQNRLWCWISALFIVGFQMSHRYISAAAVADLVMPLGSDSEMLHWHTVAIVLVISTTQKPFKVDDGEVSMTFWRACPEGIMHKTGTSRVLWPFRNLGGKTLQKMRKFYLQKFLTASCQKRFTSYLVVKKHFLAHGKKKQNNTNK